MIHIGIDGNEANVVNRVGSNHYAFGVVTAMHKLHPENVRFTVYLKSKPLGDMPPATDWWSYKVIRPGFAWTQWRLPLALYMIFNRPDVFFSPGHYAPRTAPMPTVVSIMDLAFLKMPQLFMKFKRGAKQLVDWTKYSIHQSSALIAISENTKRDIVDAYGYDAKKITVAYPGVDIDTYRPVTEDQIAKMRKKYALPKRYILHLGTLQPRKNINRLIKAFEVLPPKYKTWHLVLAGQTGWLTEEMEKAISHSPQKKRIIRTGFIDEVDIPALLSGSGCLCMVGLYEGFGMPPAEGLSCGTIPVVSNNSSLPEVVGAAGISVDPYSVASISRGIMIALDLTPEKKNRRLKLGRQHITLFNWTKSAENILKVLYELTIQK